MSRNVDIPELGSSRYIETRSPVDRHYQLYQVHPLHLVHYIVHRVVLQPPPTHINKLNFLIREAQKLYLATSVYALFWF